MHFDDIPLERLQRKHAACGGGATTLVIPAIPDGFMLILYNFSAVIVDATPVPTEVRVLLTDRDGNIDQIGAAESGANVAGTTFCIAYWQPNYPIVMYQGEFLSVQSNIATSAGEANWQELLVPITKEVAQ